MIRESPRSPRRLLWISHKLRRNLLLRRAEEDGGIANTEWPDELLMSYILGLVIAPSSQWVALASAGAGTVGPPGPGAHHALGRVRLRVLNRRSVPPLLSSLSSIERKHLQDSIAHTCEPLGGHGAW